MHNDLERKIRRGKERKDKEVDETVSVVSLLFLFDSHVHPHPPSLGGERERRTYPYSRKKKKKAISTLSSHLPFFFSKQLLNPRKDEKEEKIIMLEQKIKDMISKAEAAGEEGHVDESQDLTNQVEKLQADLEQLKKNDDVNPIFRQENKMEICHVCGAFLVMNDTSNRLDAHLQGKQHTGYQKIHETYEEMKKLRGGDHRTSSSTGGYHSSASSSRTGANSGGRYRDDYGGPGPYRDHYTDSRGDRDRGGYRDSRTYRDQPYRRDDRRDRDRDNRDGRDRRDRSRDRGGRRDHDRDRDHRRGRY